MIKDYSGFKKAGNQLASVFAQTINYIKPGMSLAKIDHFADNLIKKTDGEASFKKVDNYAWATCINLNEGIVHGIPDDKKIKKGDLVSVDMGLFLDGWNADMAYTIQIGKVDNPQFQKEIDQFLNIGKIALNRAIKAARVGHHVGDISSEIEKTVAFAGYACSRELTGHGIGRSLHQAPWIPCVLIGKKEKTPIIEEGMGLAIEVIYSLGKPGLKKDKDGWTINTQDGKISALFEKTVLVNKKSTKIITPYKWGQLIA